MTRAHGGMRNPIFDGVGQAKLLAAVPAANIYLCNLPTPR